MDVGLIRRIVVRNFGGPEVLSLDEADAPLPGPGEVAVQVAAAGVAYADVMMREGRYGGGPEAPFTPGYDLVGKVVALGPDVTEYALGQRVAAMPRWGAYAERVLLPASELVPVPPGPYDAAVVAVVLNYTTAYQLLHRVAHVARGETVLLYSAAGGVGTAVLELCALEGVRALGLASSRKLDLVRRLGGKPLDYQSDALVDDVRRLAPDGVDVVLNSVGGRSLTASCGLLRPGGRLITFGNLSGEPAPGDLPVEPTWYSIAGRKAAEPAQWRADLATLLDLLQEKRLHPVIADELPLEHAAEAHRRLEAGDLVGKLVLRP